MKTLKTATNKIVFENIRQRVVLKLSKVHLPRICLWSEKPTLKTMTEVTKSIKFNESC